MIQRHAKRHWRPLWTVILATVNKRRFRDFRCRLISLTTLHKRAQRIGGHGFGRRWRVSWLRRDRTALHERVERLIVHAHGRKLWRLSRRVKHFGRNAARHGLRRVLRHGGYRPLHPRWLPGAVTAILPRLCIVADQPNVKIFVLRLLRHDRIRI